MAEQQPSKLNTRVRFPVPAPVFVVCAHSAPAVFPVVDKLIWIEHSLDKREVDWFESNVHYHRFTVWLWLSGQATDCKSVPDRFDSGEPLQLFAV